MSDFDAALKDAYYNNGSLRPRPLGDDLMNAFRVLLFGLVALYGVNVSSAEKKDILIGMGNFEPYFIAGDESGIFADIINAVFLHIPDYQPKYVFGLNNTALWASYESGRIDAVSNLFESVKLDTCRSDPVFKFRDVAVSRLADNLDIDSISDLKGLNTVSFQGAKDFFGEEFSAVVEPEKYSEVDKPSLQARMLMGGRYDVSVGDLMIFLNERNKLRLNTKNVDVAIAIHDIFPQIYSSMGFRDKGLCNAFNDGLALIKESGEFDAIYSRYMQSFGY